MGSIRAHAAKHLRDPVIWLGLLQLVKAVGAAVASWLLAVHVFDLAQPFLAPWAALLVVHATVYRTLSRGVQQVGATVLGVLVAFAFGSMLGVDAASLGMVLLLSLAVGRARLLRAEGATVATTALVVLLTGYSDDGRLLIDRLADTAVGITVGLAVNLLVWPPLRDRVAARRIDSIDDGIGTLLTDVATGLGGGLDNNAVGEWMERTRRLDEDLDDAWAVARQASESGRLNVRRRARGRMARVRDWNDILRRLEQAIAESRSMVRTLARAESSIERWDPGFREPWVRLLAGTGRAIVAADRTGLERVTRGLEDLSRDLSNADLPERSWPVYGALIANLANITGAMDTVAAAQPVTAG